MPQAILWIIPITMKQKIKTALSGTGRMGASLKKLIKKSPYFEQAQTARREADFKNWDPKSIDGVIDFSAPDLFSKALLWAVTHKKPFVSGTTALKPSHKQALKKASKKIPIFYSENMSEGIFLFSQWVQHLFNPSAQFVLEDRHHKYKKDKPSGTALRIKNHFPKFLKPQLKIKSYREGKEFGTHRLKVKSKEEILTIEHKALNREVFSKGALKALKLIIKKKKGYYQVQHLYTKKPLPPYFN